MHAPLRTALGILLAAAALAGRACLAAEELVTTAREAGGETVPYILDSVGNLCEAFSHHGHNGIERETMDAIKQWILRGG